MSTIREKIGATAFALGVSMSAMPGLVNGQDKSLTSVNQPELKDSVKDTRTGVAKLIQALLQKGSDGTIGSNLAPIIGLAKPMPMKKEEFIVTEEAGKLEKRACYVIYENVDSSAPSVDPKHVVCTYIVRFKRSGLDAQTRYYRIDQDGNLEKVILSKSKYDKDGKIVRGSGVKEDQDITSPEVKKTFNAEMKFWLKDWLKKEQKSSPKPA